MINKRIEEVFEYVRNGASIKQSDGKGGVPITRIETIWNETIDSDRFGYADVGEDDLGKYEKYLLREGDILMTHINSPKHLGKCAMYRGQPELLIHGMNLLCLRPNDQVTEPNYLRYYFNSEFFKIQIPKIANQSVNQASFSAGKLKQLRIPIPPLETQKKIAAILDAADVYRQKTKALIEKYDEFTQSLFLEMFGDAKLNEKGWPIIFLEDACEEVIDCPHSTPKYVEKETEFPCIRTTELDKGSINWSKMKYLDHQGYLERTKRLIPQEGDIIYGREGSFGDAVIVPESCKMSLGQRVMLFRPNLSHVNSYFLHALVRSAGVYHQALRVNSGSTVGHVNVKDIKKFKLILPPISLQNEFSSCIQKIKAQKAQAQQSLEKAEELFNSLLQRAFKGELV